MRHRFVNWIVILAAILLVSPVALPQAGQRGGAQRGGSAAQPSPTAGLPLNSRDLSGIWLGRNRVLALSEQPPPRTALGRSEIQVVPAVLRPSRDSAGIGKRSTGELRSSE